MSAFAWFLSLFNPSARFSHREFFPLETGLQWVFDEVTRWPDGKLGSHSFLQEVKGTLQCGKKTYFSMNLGDLANRRGTNVFGYVRIGRTGLFVISPDRIAKGELRTFAFPLFVGKTWRVSQGRLETKVTVVGKEEVTIGKNRFPSCLHFRLHRKDIQSTEDCWHAPGVGLIKSHFLYASGRTVEITLREFRPNQ